MTLYTNGCSYSFSYDSLTYGWPTELQKLLNTDLINKGIPGSSNERILRVTTNDVLNNDSLTHVVISLTFLARFEVYFDNRYHCILPQGLAQSGNYLTNTKQRTPPDITNFVKQKILSFTHKDLDVLATELMIQVNSLKHLVESKGAKFFVFWGPPEFIYFNQTTTKNKSPDLVNLMEYLKNNSFDLDEFSFTKWAFDNEFFSPDKEKFHNISHPPMDAHEKFAKMIYDRIK